MKVVWTKDDQTHLAWVRVRVGLFRKRAVYVGMVSPFREPKKGWGWTAYSGVASGTEETLQEAIAAVEKVIAAIDASVFASEVT